MSFSATAPYNVTTWAPNVNGIVNSIAFNGTNCADAYIGGKFTAVDGTKVANIAEVSTSGTGALVTAFGHTANGQVETLLGVKGHILAGGYYTTINGSTNKYMTSLNPTTGKDDGFISLNISGNYQFPGVASNGTRVYNQSLSHGGTLDLVMGDFTSVGGRARQQIFMLNLATSPATVTAWTSPEWDGSQGEATPADPTTDTRTSAPRTSRSTSRPRPGRRLTRRSTSAPPATTRTAGRSGRHRVTGCATPPRRSRRPRAPVLHTWVNYTGCDSLYSAAADASTAYFGGHERWSIEPQRLRRAGPRRDRRAGHGGPVRRRPACSPSTRPAPAAWAPTTCSTPAPGCGSPATT